MNVESPSLLKTTSSAHSDGPVLVEEVHRTGVDADSSDSDAGSAATSSHKSATSKDSSYRKVIGRSQSVSSTGSFVATSEWVILHVINFDTLDFFTY